MKNNEGFILVLVMLFLSILSLLAYGILEVSLLELKMSISYQDKVASFYLAEKYLLQAEEQVIGKEHGFVSILNRPEINITVKEIDSVMASRCEVRFYRLTASANYHRAKTVLQSTVSKVGATSDCDPKLNVSSSRQSFLILR